MHIATAGLSASEAGEAVAAVQQAIGEGAWTEAEIWAGVIRLSRWRWYVRLSNGEPTTITFELT